MKGSYYLSFPNMTSEKILGDFCLRPQVVLSPKAKDRELTEGTYFKELNGNNSLWGYKWGSRMEKTLLKDNKV